MLEQGPAAARSGEKRPNPTVQLRQFGRMAGTPWRAGHSTSWPDSMAQVTKHLLSGGTEDRRD